MQTEELLKDKNYAPKNLGEVCVLGLGKTGNVVASYLCELLKTRVESVHVYAGDKKEFAMRAADRLLTCGATVSFDDKEIIHKYDLCITSPGISEFTELIRSAKANCTEVISEIEFAWRESSSKSKWVAISGTNGKTTTTSLTTHILNSSGKRAKSVGNIGNVALDAVACDERKSIYEHTDIYVAEVSSYQLVFCDKFAPDVACLLNITPDHLDWHVFYENYVQAKLKLFDNAKMGVINIDDPEIANNLEVIQEKLDNNLIINTFNSEILSVNYNNMNHEIIPISDMRIIGEHNCVNARAASSICLALGLSEEQIKNGIASFESLEHRLEPCGIIAGVRLYNDSKATNVDSVLVAINSFKKGKAIFLLGGRDKNTELDKLVNQSLENLKGVVIYGEAKQRFYDAFKEKCNNDEFLLLEANNMKEAFKIAMENAYPGDFVVLSPACSSFDEFDNFEERGCVFKDLVKKCM